MLRAIHVSISLTVFCPSSVTFTLFLAIIITVLKHYVEINKDKVQILSYNDITCTMYITKILLISRGKDGFHFQLFLLIWPSFLFQFQSFERIICENRIQDLQPSLASAVKSINRWHLIQSSVPYILLCCSKLLSNRCRLGNVERLGNAERELLYTLHWILLEGPRICCIVDTESLLYPQTIIEQFVHGLIPHVYSMRESDLTFRLENGISIWGPLWKHEKPQVTPFVTKVIMKDPASGEDDGFKSAAAQNEPDAESEFAPATVFDVAILKCLSSTGWAEDGIVWALRYLTEYLKREFNLPDEGISSGHSREIRLNSPACGSPAESTGTDSSAAKTLNVDSSGDNLTVDVESTKPDREVMKTADGEMQNAASEDTKEDSNLSVCSRQTNDYNSNSATKDEENLEATYPQTETDSKGENVQGSECLSANRPSSDGNQDALKIPHSSDEDKLDASGLARTSSIKLRIRVQSSPVLSGGGRVITAVASPSGGPVLDDSRKAVDEDNFQDLSDSGGFLNPKVFIKPSDTLQVPLVGATNDADMQENDSNGSLENNVANSTSNYVSNSEAKPVSSGGEGRQAYHGPTQSSFRDSNNSSGAFESIVSYECEEGSHTERIPSDKATSVGQLSQLQLYKHLSERPSSSHTSSSSAESESQPLLNPAKTPQAKPTSILESLDTPRGSLSINQDSVMRIDRYFVFPGTADYITTDGRLSIVVILQALYSILHENPTSRICDATLTVLSHAVKIHGNINSKKRDSSFQYDDRTVAETQAVGFRSPHSENVLGRLRASFYGRPPSFLGLAVGCLVTLIKALGCPLGEVLRLSNECCPASTKDTNDGPVCILC